MIVDLVVLFRKFFFGGWLVTKLKRETCLVSQFKRRDYILNMCVEGGGSWGEVSIKSGHDEDVGDWIELVIKKERLTSN